MSRYGLDRRAFLRGLLATTRCQVTDAAVRSISTCFHGPRGENECTELASCKTLASTELKAEQLYPTT